MKTSNQQIKQAKFKKQPRQIPFTCIHPQHPSNTRGKGKGDIVFLNNYGPICHHCALLESRGE